MFNVHVFQGNSIQVLYQNRLFNHLMSIPISNEMNEV